MSNLWDTGVHAEIESLIAWMSRFENQHHFVSLQGAYDRWLEQEGFRILGDNYSMALQVILVFLSCCIANPVYRRYLSHPDGHRPEVVEYTLLQVTAPEETEDRTFWEFLTEENFRRKYRDWCESQAAE